MYINNIHRTSAAIFQSMVHAALVDSSEFTARLCVCKRLILCVEMDDLSHCNMLQQCICYKYANKIESSLKLLLLSIRTLSTAGTYYLISRTNVKKIYVQI